MNKRILELADQAVDGIIPGPWEIPDEFCEKFAELIVRECIESGNNLINHYINNHSEQEQAPLLAAIADYSNEIKKHFGVEDHKGWVCPKCGIDRTKDICSKGYSAAMTGECPMTATAQTGVE